MREPPRRIPLLTAALLAVLLGSVLTAGALYLGWSLLLQGAPLRTQSGTVLDIVKISLGATAGVGAAVALVVGFRRQSVAEMEHRIRLDENTREIEKGTLERFDASVRLFGDATSGATRLAGAYSLLALADEWAEGRQMCVDVLCGYLRLSQSGGPEATDDERNLRAEVARSLLDRFAEEQPARWSGIYINLSHASLPGMEVRNLVLRECHLNLSFCTTAHGEKFTVSSTVLSGCRIDMVTAGPEQLSLAFDGCRLVSCTIAAEGAILRAGCEISMRECDFVSGRLDLKGGRIEGGTLDLTASTFAPDGSDRPPSVLDLTGLTMTAGRITLDRCTFTDGTSAEERRGAWKDKRRNNARKVLTAASAALSAGSTLSARNCTVESGALDFDSVRLRGGTLDFSGSWLHECEIRFTLAELNAGRILFENAMIQTEHRDQSGRIDDWFAAVASTAAETGPPVYFTTPLPYATVSLHDATLTGAVVSFCGVECDGGDGHNEPNARIELNGMRLDGGVIDMTVARFGSAVVDLWGPRTREGGTEIAFSEHSVPLLIISQPKVARDHGLFTMYPAMESRSGSSPARKGIDVMEEARRAVEFSNLD